MGACLTNLHTVTILVRHFLNTRNYGGRSRQDATPLELDLDIASVRESIRVCANLCELAQIYASLSEST